MRKSLKLEISEQRGDRKRPGVCTCNRNVIYVTSKENGCEVGEKKVAERNDDGRA
jgi:hypothetical protein